MRAKWIMRGLAGAAIGLAVAGTADADSKPIRIMVLNDQTGVSSGASGLGSVRAAKLAIEDFGGSIDGSPVEVIAIDHQTKVDIASAAARKAYDQDGVDAIFDIANSAASLAVQEIARERGKIVVHVGSAVSDLYGKACSPTGALWLYDTYSLGRGLTSAVFAEGGTSWYFLTADYAFGKAIETEVSSTLRALGGQVLGSVRHPMGTQDFSSFLLQAQGAQPKVIGLLNTGEDVLNSLKQAQEFGMTGNTKFATFIFYTQMMKAAGPEIGKGLQYLSGYYWDRDDGSRAFAKRYAAVSNGAMPSEPNAGVYSAVRHYLRAVQAAKSHDGLTVMRQMKATPLDDFFAPGATIRADGRLMNDQYLVEGKGKEEMQRPWDVLKVIRTVKAADIIRPIEDGGCTRLDSPRS
ncbi:ABC transporter substrate-binding protein [Azospirillum sp. CT11-132]|uniref:ABC transporter substrate-binding protein n=1 Tax=Azospirillum sp. CT11-132 TaxID=3396317 RepID=UPI0039A5132C